MSDELKHCVACAEQIKAAAKLCRHCGVMQDDERFSSEPTNPPQEESTETSRDDEPVYLSEWVYVPRRGTSNRDSIPTSRGPASESKLEPGAEKSPNTSGFGPLIAILFGLAIVVVVILAATGIGKQNPNTNGTGGNAGVTDSGVTGTNSGHNEERCHQVYVANPNANQYGMVGDQVAQGSWQQQCHMVWVPDN